MKLTDNEPQSCSGLRAHRVPLTVIPWLKCAVELQSEHLRRAQDEKHRWHLLSTPMEAGRWSPTPVSPCVNVAGNTDKAPRCRSCSSSPAFFLSLIETSNTFTLKSCGSVVLSLQLPRRVWINPECALSRAARSGTHQLRTLLDESLCQGSPILWGRMRLWGDTEPKYSN